MWKQRTEDCLVKTAQADQESLFRDTPDQTSSLSVLQNRVVVEGAQLLQPCPGFEAGKMQGGRVET